ncbi:hypothetical protein MLD52_01895 [Puniceicoccaceae bacterium K14]|nr:hypothetical protein [Puniceicoccaceae bacterium K14]
MNLFFVLFNAFCALLLAAPSTLGEEGVARNEGKEEGFLFTAMAFGDRSFKGIKFVNVDDELEELDFNPYGRSRSYRIDEKDRVIEFVSERINHKGESILSPLARFDRSKLSDRGLLVFFPNYTNEAELPFRVIGVEEGDSAFTAGDFRFLNLTGTQLLAKIGNEESVLETGFSPVFHFDVEDRNPIGFQFAAKVKDKWKRVYATRRQSDLKRGTLFILKPPARLDSLKIRVEALIETLP